MIRPEIERLESNAPPTEVPAPPHPDRSLIETLQDSAVFRDFQQAFQETTGLPLSLQGPDAFGLAHNESKLCNPFCALLAAHGRCCSACLEALARVREKSNLGAATLTCHAGLLESSVPIRSGDHVIAYLQVGQVRVRSSTSPEIERILRRLARWGLAVPRRDVLAAYRRTRVVSRQRYTAMLELLSIFAGHLSLLSNALMLTRQSSDLPLITKVKTFILEHLDDQLTLGKVARYAHMSSCYFCKIFHRTTGLHFIEYVGRARVERVKTLLLNRQTRISEAAYEAGFTSLSQFNRTFKRIVGEEPRVWRDKRLA